MIGASDEFRHALGGNRVIAVKADILRQGQVIEPDIEIIRGSITADSGAEIRRRVTMVLVDPLERLVPSTAQDLLFPNGNEVRIRYGIQSHDGSIEYVVLGTFRVARPKFTDTGDTLLISVEGYDRSRTIIRNRFSEPYRVAAGTNYAVAIRNLIQSRFPFDLDFGGFMETTRNTPNLVFEAQDDPWAAATNMAASLGAEVFFNSSGNPVLQREPDPEEGEITWEYVEGEDCTVTMLERDLDDERTYNHVIATGESTTNEVPVRAEAMDNNPSSPTFVLGPYGRVTYWQASPYITTVSQAQDAANAALLRVIGTVEQVAFEGLPNVLHEPGDIIRIERQRMKIDARYVLDALSIPLDPSGSMTGTTRQRRL